MGGRGSAGGAGKFGKEAGVGLSKRDIERANAASIIDMGDIINRTFERNIAEINGLSLSDNEKKDATTKEIKAMEDANILIIKGKYKVQLDEDVKYISSNCSVDDDGIVTTDDSDENLSYIVY